MRLLAILFLCLLLPWPAIAAHIVRMPMNSLTGQSPDNRSSSKAPEKKPAQDIVSIPPVLTGNDCVDVALSDEEYSKVLAQNGDANAAYLRGALLDYQGNGNHSYSEEVLQWFRKSAELGNVKAMGWLCDRLFQTRGRKAAAPEEDIKWCSEAAAHGHANSQAALGRFYMDGIILPQDNQKSYFWFKLAGNPTGNARIVKERLTSEQIAAIDAQVAGWKPVPPVEEHTNHSALDDEISAIHFRESVPVNIPGLLCGGHARDCRLADSCGNLVGIICPRGGPTYMIVDKTTKATIKICSQDCTDFVPAEWTCTPPRNMPIKTDVVTCGDIWGVDHGSAGDGPYDFIDSKTGQKIGGCSFWGGPCTPPPQWTCGRPSNYH